MANVASRVRARGGTAIVDLWCPALVAFIRQTSRNPGPHANRGAPTQHAHEVYHRDELETKNFVEKTFQRKFKISFLKIVFNLDQKGFLNFLVTYEKDLFSVLAYEKVIDL